LSELLFLIILFFVAVMLFFLATTFYAGFIAAPFVPSPGQIIKKALEISGLQPGEKFYDLGSGDGRALIAAVKYFGALARGFEISVPLCLFSRINIFLNGCSSKAEVFWRNFYNEDLSQADVVFCYLTPTALRKLENKFYKELKKGARLVVFSTSPLKWEAAQIIRLEGMGPITLYIKE
jgi:cyclopropane fatty-acyl-phospholipid synthase-like methyltransferase